MIITKNSPFTKTEVEKLKEEFDTYIKTVIDLDKKVSSAGANRHFESEKILLKEGSEQKNIWGGGIDIKTKDIDCNSFINIRPGENNNSNEILDPKTREEFITLTKFFFKDIYD